MAGSSVVGLGSQWCPAEREVGNCSKGSPTDLSEELDLRIENERKLNEMREQGKQMVLQREEQDVAEEGAANLLARFHNLHWKRQHHLETNSSQQLCGNGKILVPVKRYEEEEYLPNIRQPKKVRPRNIKKKQDIITLEEVTHKPRTILPAGYQPPAPATNAWALRRGTDLFDHCKLSLMIHGPDDTDEVIQRVVEESLITLREEQKRIINMYSGSYSASEDKKQSKAACKPLPNEMLESWSDTPKPNTGAGDGAWMQRNARSSQTTAGRSQFADALKDEVSKKHKFGASLPENSSYNSRSCGVQNRPQKLRSMNGADEGFAPREKLGAGNSMEKENCDMPGKPRLLPEVKALRFDAGDGYHNGPYETDKLQPELSKRTEKDCNLESLGFSKTRSGVHRKSSHRNAHKQMSSTRKGLTVQDDGKKKTETRVGNFLHNRQSRHISALEPMESSSNGRSSLASTPEVEDDPDPWLESQEEPIYPSQVCLWASQEKSDTRSNAVIQSQPRFPQRTVRERDSTSAGNQIYRNTSGPRRANRSTMGGTTYKTVWNSSQDVEKHAAQNISSKPRERTEETEFKMETVLEAPEKQRSKPNIPEESSHFINKSPDGVGESKKINDAKSAKIKRIREQIKMLDTQLRTLSTDSGDSSPKQGDPVDCTTQPTLDNSPVQFLKSSDSNGSQIPFSPGADPASVAAYVANLQQQQATQQHLAQQQHLILQATAAAACPPAFPTHPLALNWMAQARTPAVQSMGGNPEWLAQMGMGASGTAASTNAHAAAAPSVGQDPASAPHSTIPSSMPAPLPGLSPAAQNMSPGLTPNAVGADALGMTAHAQWLAQYCAWQQQEQNRMAHLMAQRYPSMPGMLMMPQVAMPMPLPQPQPQPQPQLQPQTPNCGMGGAVWPNAGSVPSQYEGDWVVSASDLARLEQGLPSPNSKEGESNKAAAEPSNPPPKGQQHSNVLSSSVPELPDSALSPTDSVRAPRFPLPTVLKAARTPMHLADYSAEGPNSNAAGEKSPPQLDLSAFNPRMPPPEAPKGLKQSNTQLDEPRGRGRLR